ncbi:MAG: hypothetical protein EAZ11_12310 [Curvibacter sp.]|nr:MAG: hypothetical protein EAZ11_12310 [Curvibacter sp.]
MNEQTNDTATASVDPSKAESLDDLAGLGKVVDGGGMAAAPGVAGDAVQELPQATEEDITDMLIMAREMIAPAADSAGVMTEAQVVAIWSDDKLRRIAKPLVSIMNRHGVGVGEAFEKFGPYVMLAAAIGGPAFATYKAIRQNAIDLAKHASSPQQQQPA